jgi:hypothetical protein
MFFVGLLLYFGETVFSNATEEEEFTVHVNSLVGTPVDVSGCKKNDILSGFMKKFEEAYEKKNIGVKLKDWNYNLIYNGTAIVRQSQPVKDISLADLKIGEGTDLNFMSLLKPVKSDEDSNISLIDNKNDDELFHNIKKKIINGKHRKDSEILIPPNDTFPKNITTINPLDDKDHPTSESVCKDESPTTLENENIPKGPITLHPSDNLKKKKSPATSTCPCRRVCRLCGC